MVTRYRGDPSVWEMSRPLLKLGGRAGDILRDLLHLAGASEAENLTSGADSRDSMPLQAPDICVELLVS